MLETSSAVLEARRHAVDYWGIDGLPALTAGLSTVLFAVLWLVAESRLYFWWEAVIALFLILSFSSLLESKEVALWLKRRITYPRTGYVVLPKPIERDPYHAISVINEPPMAPIIVRASRRAIGISEIPIFLVFWFCRSWLGGVLAGLIISLFFWWKTKEDPAWAEIAGSVIAGLIAGLVSALSPVSGGRRIGIVILVLGATSVARGATLLICYLRQHPAPPPVLPQEGLRD